ncbi:ATP-dependent DNA helicase [soil metagenome]
MGGDGLKTSPAIVAALRGHQPSDEQWAAISHPLEPAYLVAGAGAGKTAVMAARIVYAIEACGLHPSQVLGLAFTNKAAGELQSRVHDALLASGSHRPEDITVQTYHAFAASIVRDHGLLVGIEPDSGLLSQAQQWQMVLSCVDRVDEPFGAIEMRTMPTVVRSALSLASSISDHCIGVGRVEASADAILASGAIDETSIMDTAAKRRELCRLVRAYTDAKRESRRIDFGDQVVKAVEILRRFDDVRDSYHQRFPVVLLDEYQDTNVAQRLLMQQLVVEGGAITAVGDARQAIYAFRGATMFNLIEFPSHFARADGRAYDELSLSENFRSGARILTAANEIVGAITPERRPGRALKPLAANGGGRVEMGLFTDERAEAKWIAERCEQLHGAVLAPGRDPVSWRDMAVLARRRSSMTAVMEALEAQDIPCEVVGLAGLLTMPEVVEVVAWLRALETRPGANRWLARILMGPRWRVHYRDLALLARWAAHENHALRLTLAGGDTELAADLDAGDVAFALVEAIDHAGEIEGLGVEARRRLDEFATRLADLRRKANSPLLELVQEIIEQSGVLHALRSSASRTSAAALQNLSNFLDVVADFEPLEGEANLRAFVAYLDAADEAEETLEAAQPAEQDSVKLMTVHSAKGLEFECVFVPAVAAGEGRDGAKKNSIFPSDKVDNPLTSYGLLPYEVREDAGSLPEFQGDPKAFKEAVAERTLEDERRLFYVALTRAKQFLAVTAAHWYGRNNTPKGPSRFWEELETLGEDVLEVVERSEPPPANPVFELLAERRTWPPPARPEIADPVFPDGPWAVADDVAADRKNLDDLLSELDPWAQERARALVKSYEEQCSLLVASRDAATEATARRSPDIVSATSLVRLAAGEITELDLVRPAPSAPGEPRRRGTEVHRLIEEQSRGLALYPDEHELDEPDSAAEPTDVERLIEVWRERGYPGRTIAVLPSGEPMIELPFTIRHGDRLVRGRIDAVYDRGGEGLEIVDFKTGRRFEPAGDDDQLGIYARALVANGLVPAGTKLRLTYEFLDGGPPISREWGPPA